MDSQNYFVTTADGSKTIYNPQIGENYHSRNGALQESKHVFLNAGLKHFLAYRQDKKVSILEVGFGTGLNFLLSADWCTAKGTQLDYVGIEAYPLDENMIGQTGYDAYVSTAIWKAFTERYMASLEELINLNPNIKLHTAPLRLMEYKSDRQFDVIYFDAFASANQPEMWNEEAISHTISFLKPGGVFVTYAITGNLKRMLKALGCTIEKVPGAAGKREMLRATKLS
ncbi:tRNA (5-methylaminomethyl-2-thiouridylate)-methyltransferase [Mucilaginibacter sp. PPCGB 2223]|uniref:tRNA (5-methylaminomethyl-2-thiouridine)(34)-methyltransferase MnmD n=1 Tax=Mucilaginibacter sp. PPCGB 2223 TaxID=1886027 RepID=UPI0008244A2A|nr:tRNA (5-methylaminomethyl-2-thiouridine)(34)-methyltransferase MnmD [Mucilaginibacter sp. PPCGB 2223]OCX52886.1 tRNA (5-methylaminomethyl-2-thiouridylate)-methyltransferase [Mucilaginibacter sp. PPCGB 2223]